LKWKCLLLRASAARISVSCSNSVRPRCLLFVCRFFSAVCHLFLLSSHLNFRDVVSAIMLHHSVLCKAFGMRAVYVAHAKRSFTQLAVLSRLLCDVSALFTLHSRSPIDMPSCVCSNYSRLLKGIVIVALPVLLAIYLLPICAIYLLPVCAICCIP
jgi:hypothetical protein